MKLIRAILLGALFIVGVLFMLCLIIFPVAMRAITGNMTWLILYLPIMGSMTAVLWKKTK